MYQAHWGLHASPFSAAAAQAVIDESPVHAEALARLVFLVENRSQVGLVTGPTGSGKSLVLAEFARRQQTAGASAALVPLAGLSPADALVEIADQWGANADPAASAGLLWRWTADRLAQLHLEQVPAVLLLDDAGAAAADVLLLVQRLLRVAGAELTVVLAARDQHASRLPAWLHESAELRIELAPWNGEETGNYLRAALAHAGRREPAFDEQAAARLFQLSGGVPRRVSRLAQLAMVAGAGRNLAQIDEQTVLAVHEELCPAR